MPATPEKCGFIVNQSLWEYVYVRLDDIMLKRKSKVTYVTGFSEWYTVMWNAVMIIS